MWGYHRHTTTYIAPRQPDYYNVRDLNGNVVQTIEPVYNHSPPIRFFWKSVPISTGDFGYKEYFDLYRVGFDSIHVYGSISCKRVCCGMNVKITQKISSYSIDLQTSEEYQREFFKYCLHEFYRTRASLIYLTTPQCQCTIKEGIEYEISNRS